MTDTTTNETLSSEPAGGKITEKKKGGIPLPVKIAGVLALVVFGGIWLLMPSGSNAPSVVSNVGTVANIDSTPGGDNQRNNEDYARQVQLQNDINSKVAEEKGESYIPFLEKPLEPIKSTEEDIKVEEETPVAPEPQRVVTTVRTNDAPIPVVRRSPVEHQPQVANGQQQENPYVKNMTGAFEKIDATMKPMASATQDFSSERIGAGATQAGTQEQGRTANGQPVVNTAQDRSLVRRDANGQPVVGQQGQAGANGPSLAAIEAGNVAPEQQQGKILIKAGDVLYARILGGVTSDHEAPVIAEILNGGSNAHARLVGSYGIDDNTKRMVVSFRQMTWSDGKARSINAYAVDENTGEQAVRSGIERRYMARYAPIFASKFIGGLASAAGQSDTSIVNTESGQYAVMSKKTMEEAAWTGLGDAMSAISDDIASNAPKGPKIILGAGATVGIMFVQDLREEDK